MSQTFGGGQYRMEGAHVFFESMDMMWLAALHYAYMGERRDSRAGGSTEMIGWSAKLDASKQMTFLTNERRALDPAYAAAELLWYLSRASDIEMLLAYAPQYEKFAEEGTLIAHGAYGSRLKNNLERTTDGVVEYDLLDLAVEHLRTEPNSRQCLVPIFTPEDLWRATPSVSLQTKPRDIPCTGSWTFYNVNGRLDMVVYMRSNDVWLGLPYDVFTFTCVQRLVADELGLEVGFYTHHVGSLHLYDRNRVAAQEAVGAGKWMYRHDWKTRCLAFDVYNALRIESAMRVSTGPGEGSRMAPTGAMPAMKNLGVVGDMLRDAVLCCATKFRTKSHPLVTGVKSQALAHAVNVLDAHKRKEKPCAS